LTFSHDKRRIRIIPKATGHGKVKRLRRITDGKEDQEKAAALRS
jgi:hypothetical protein